MLIYKGPIFKLVSLGQLTFGPKAPVKQKFTPHLNSG